MNKSANYDLWKQANSTLDYKTLLTRYKSRGIYVNLSQVIKIKIN